MRSNQRTRLRQTVYTYLREVRRDFVAAMLCMLGFTAAELLWPWPLKFVFDHVLLDEPAAWPLSLMPGAGDKSGLLFAICGSMLALALLRGSFAYSQMFLTTRIGYRLVCRLRRELFWQLQRLSLGFHTRSRSGELLTKVTSDTNVLRDVFGDWALMLTSHVLTVVGMLAIMLVMNPRLTLVVLATFPVLVFGLMRLYRGVKKSARQQRKREGVMASRISELLTSVSLVQAFGRERYEQERFVEESEQVVEDSIRSARMDAATARAVEVVGALGTILVVLVGARQVLAGHMLPGDVLIFLGYMTNMYRPLRNVAKLSTKFSRAAVSAERIGEILEMEPEIADRPGAIEAPPLQGAIALSGVSFGYEAGHDVLRDVSFSIAPGQRVALVGGSGAGKSTIINLLLRLYEAKSGTITIDGVDVRDYRRESLRREIGIVLQDALLLGATIAENISYGKPDATAAEIEEAARQAHAHEFIERLPNGYRTVIGERGVTLSGGQRQRISLARAIIKRPSILILDEPTAAVDPESERLMRETIDRLQRGKTMLVIAHRLSFIEHADQILVLDGGRIVEQGTHAQLTARRGRYWRLHAAGRERLDHDAA